MFTTPSLGFKNSFFGRLLKSVELCSKFFCAAGWVRGCSGKLPHPLRGPSPWWINRIGVIGAISVIEIAYHTYSTYNTYYYIPPPSLCAFTKVKSYPFLNPPFARRPSSENLPDRERLTRGNIQKVF